MDTHRRSPHRPDEPSGTRHGHGEEPGRVCTPEERVNRRLERETDRTVHLMRDFADAAGGLACVREPGPLVVALLPGEQLEPSRERGRIGQLLLHRSQAEERPAELDPASRMVDRERERGIRKTSQIGNVECRPGLEIWEGRLFTFTREMGKPLTVERRLRQHALEGNDERALLAKVESRRAALRVAGEP